MAEKIVVINSGRAGYRRAGFSLAAGRNELDAAKVDEAKLAKLQADSRLTVIVPSPSAASDSAAGLLATSELPTAVAVEQQALLAAMAQLEPDNPDHFTTTGKPQVDVLGALLGEPISAAERDAAWEQYQSEPAEA